MNAMDRQLLMRIGKVPAGERLPLSAFARELDATVSVVMSAVQGLVEAGKLDRDTLRPTIAAVPADGTSGAALFARIKAEAERRGMTASGASVAIWGQNSSIYMLRKSPRPRAGTVAKVEAWIQSPPANLGDDRAEALPASATPASAAPSGAAEKVGGGDARSDDAAPADRPTGAELVAKIEAEAHRRGITPMKLVESGISMNAKTWLDQLRFAKRPKALTVERVDALIAGKPVPSGQRVTTPPEMLLPRGERAARGLPPSRRMEREAASLAHTAKERSKLDQLREASDVARADRRPGETLADRVRRCGREVEAEEADTTTGLARKRDFPAIPADRWSKLAALAGELGKRRGEVLLDVIDAGILCVTEDLREGER